MASEFLKQKAAGRSKEVDREFGPGAYGGSGTQKQSSAAFLPSPSAVKAPGSYWQTQSGIAGGGFDNGAMRYEDSLEKNGYFKFNQNHKTTSGGFYKQPAFGARTTRLESEVQAQGYALNQKRQELEQAKIRTQEAEKSVKFIENYTKRLYKRYEAERSTQAQELYIKAYAGYEKALSAQSAAQGLYNTLRQEEEPLLESFLASKKKLGDYVSEQKKLYKDWKGTIREAGAIEKELSGVESQLESLTAQRAISSDTEQALERQYPLIREMKNELANERINEWFSALDEQISKLQEDKALLEDELWWSNYYKYEDLKKNEDFERLSKYKSTKKGEETDYLLGIPKTKSIYGDYDYEYINKNKEVIDQHDYERTGGDALTLFYGPNELHKQFMTDDEIATFNYLYAKMGKEQAYHYFDYIKNDLQYRRRKQMEDSAREYAKEHPVIGSVNTVLQGPLKGVGYFYQAADMLDDGKLEQNAEYNKFSYANNSIRDEVSQKIAKNWGPAGSFLYQTGMSMADFIYTTGISGGNQTLALAIMGTGAAADGTIAAKDRGLSDEQAFALGTIAGAGGDYYGKGEPGRAAGHDQPWEKRGGIFFEKHPGGRQRRGWFGLYQPICRRFNFQGRKPVAAGHEGF